MWHLACATLDLPLHAGKLQACHVTLLPRALSVGNVHCCVTQPMHYPGAMCPQSGCTHTQVYATLTLMVGVVCQPTPDRVLIMDPTGQHQPFRMLQRSL
jgi:hypothetical protein